VAADSGSPIANAPSAVCRKPVSPSPGWLRASGRPSYVISTVNAAPRRIPAGGVTVSSAPLRANLASRPSTSTSRTVSPSRSRLKLDRSAVAVAAISAVPLSRSVAGSYLTRSV
jgi:hypothetical protein